MKFFFLSIFTLIISLYVFAQENSPYSRYGLGEMVPNQNIVNRGMGGVSIAYSDYGLIGSPLNINLVNPASLGNLTNTKNFSNTIFDLGTEVDFKTIRSTVNTEKFSSRNTVMSYFQLAFPLSTKKMEKNGMGWAMALGLKPISRINYKIESYGRLTNIDSIHAVNEGQGGINQVNISSGFKFTGKGKHNNEICVGFNTGYNFGFKDYSTKLAIVNDTTPYQKSNYEEKTQIRGVFLNTGFQYRINLNNKSIVRIGAFANVKNVMNAKKNTIYESFIYDYNGAPVTQDSIYTKQNIPGKIVMPTTYGGGFTYQSKNKEWLFGSDVEFTDWNSYLSYNKKDSVKSNWTVRVGAEYYPIKIESAKKSYLSYIKYRAGFYFGPDYIKYNDTRINYAVTGGFSLPLTTPRYIQTRGEFVSLNTSVEIGARGNKDSYAIRENFTRINIGISMNARWFQKRSYD